MENQQHFDRAEHVLLVHGLASNKYFMRPLEWRLRSDGYQPELWGYWSITGGIAVHAERMRQVLDRLEQDERITRFHLVTHSMGCILGRWIIARRPLLKLHRWIMLAPPNRGSHVARMLSSYLGFICQPLHELSDDTESLVNRLDHVAPGFDEVIRQGGVEIGVISAARDHVVPSYSTALAAAKDSIVMDGLHTDILFRRSVYRQILSFLRLGHFSHPGP